MTATDNIRRLKPKKRAPKKRTYHVKLECSIPGTHGKTRVTVIVPDTDATLEEIGDMAERALLKLIPKAQVLGGHMIKLPPYAKWD